MPAWAMKGVVVSLWVASGDLGYRVNDPHPRRES